MQDLELNCRMHPDDTLEATVTYDGVFLDVRHCSNGQHCDIKLSPTQARELAQWLEQAATEAEQAE